MIGTLSLSYWVISREAEATRHGYSIGSSSPTTTGSHGAGRWTILFAYYCLLIHCLVFMFPLRSMYSTWDLTRNLEKVARSKSLQNFKLAHRRRGSSTSLSSSETLTSSRDGSIPSSSTTSEAGDLDPELYTDGDAEGHHVVHAIIVPNYKEEVDTLRETLDVLASHPQARDNYDVSSCSNLLFVGQNAACHPGYALLVWSPIPYLHESHRSILAWNSGNTTPSSRQ